MADCARGRMQAAYALVRTPDPGQILPLQVHGRSALLMVHSRLQHGKFTHLAIPDMMDVTIGSARDNAIVYTVAQVSAHHACLRYTHGAWQLQAVTGAVYVNGKRTRERPLSDGDAVTVMGLTLIPFPGGLAMNHPSDGFSFGTWKPVRLEPEKLRAPVYQQPEITFFSRMPRIQQPVETTQVSAQLPPAMAAEAPAQSALTLAPALTGGLMMMLSGVGSIASLGMLAGNIAVPFLGRKKAREQHELKEKQRQESYRRYLLDTEKLLCARITRGEEMLRSQYPAPSAEAAVLLHDNRHLWQRRIKDEDFLSLRMGTGRIPLACSVELPPAAPGEQEDPLRESLQQFLRRGWALENVPIMLDLRTHQVMGLAGPAPMRAGMQANLICQLALHAAYDEMQLCLLGMPEGKAAEYTRLPHLWSSVGGVRMLDVNDEDIAALLPVLEQEIALRQDDKTHAGELLVIISDSRIASRYVIEHMLLERPLRHVHVMVFAGHSHELPSSCTALIGLKDGRGALRLNNGPRMDFIPDAADALPVGSVTAMLANCRLSHGEGAFSLPDMVPFLQLFGVTIPDSLNILASWKKHAASLSLAVPIGIDEDGQRCMLDIHERGHGPHGLIAGTTGSGKSELMITWILALAAVFSPNEVAFALIDFKGGGMASAFEGLPHLAGIVSNLDGSTVSRSILSVRSELDRRQRLFLEAKRILHTTNMNIDQYQRAFAQGKLPEPMPHLLIMVDEFAQLRSNAPDFLQELIRVAQIGRSLGVHLVLSTQKPSGVVDDQIWSNTNFRICLRVQTAQDSQEMLHKPDAASLKGVGRFLIQYEDVLIRAQSGWTGAPLGPGQSDIPTLEAEELDQLGRAVHRAAWPKEQTAADATTQLDAVLSVIRAAGKAAGLQARPLWMPEMSQAMPLDALKQKYPSQPRPYDMQVLLGGIDLPEQQARCALQLSLCTGKNTLIYGTHGSGKRMLLETLLQSLLPEHPAEELHVYLLDLVGDGLSAYEQLPQVGQVIAHDDSERLSGLMRMLEREIRQRRSILTMAEPDEGLRLQKAGAAHMLVMIHGLSAFLDWVEPQRDALLTLLADGPRYGIHFIATAMNPTGLSTRVTQMFSQLLVLQLASRDDYAMLLGNTGGLFPGECRGRGLIRTDKLHEFQLASPAMDAQAFCAMADVASGSPGAPSIPIMPEQVTSVLLRERMRRMKPLRLPVGIYRDLLSTAYLSGDRSCVFRVIGIQDNLDYFLREWLPALSPACDTALLGTVPDMPGVTQIPPDQWAAYAEALLKDRLAEQDQDDGVTLPKKLTVIAVQDVQALWERLQQDTCPCGDMGSDIFAPLLMKIRPTWRYRFVLCGDANAFSHLHQPEWYQRAAANSDAVYLGEGVKIQYVCPISGKPDMEEEPFPLGYVISCGRARGAMMAGVLPEDTGEEEEW